MADDFPVDRTRRQLLKATVTLGAGLGLRCALAPLAALARTPEPPGLLSFHDRRSGVVPDRIAGAVDLGLDNLLADGVDDIFPRPFELDLLATRPDLRAAVQGRLCQSLERMKFAREEFSPVEYVSLPKRQPGEFRRCAVLEPLDAAAYLAATLLAAPLIEAHRQPQARRSVFSYRFAPAGRRLFHRDYTYRAFLRHVNQRITNGQTASVAVADVEAYYDHIAIRPLGDQLRLCGVPDAVVAYLSDLLAYWSLDGVRGLPVGSNASRILAEAVLIPVDRSLVAQGIDFARYVDDYRLFAPDARTARRWLDSLATQLGGLGLRLNARKTAIYDTCHLQRELTQQWGVHLAQSAGAPTPTPRRTPGNPSPPAPQPTTEPDAHERYSSLIPPEFRPPSEAEQVRLRNTAPPLRSPSRASTPDDIRRFITAVLYGHGGRQVLQLLDVIVTHPQFASYVVNALLASSDDLPTAQRRRVAREFGGLLLDPRPQPTHVTLEIIRLLGSNAYANRRALERYYVTPGAPRQTYARRATLDALASLGIDPAVIVRLQPTADARTQRALIRVLSTGGGAARGAADTGRARARRDPALAALLVRVVSTAYGRGELTA